MEESFVLNGFTQVTDENLSVRENGASYEFVLTEGTWSGSDSAGVAGSGTAMLVVAKSSVATLTGGIQIDASGVTADIALQTADFSTLVGGLEVDGAGVVTQAAGQALTVSEFQAAAVSFALSGAVVGDTGMVALTASKNIEIAGGSISTTSGNVRFVANDAGSDSDNSNGVTIEAGDITTTSGAISISGTSLSGGIFIDETSIRSEYGDIILIGRGLGDNTGFSSARGIAVRTSSITSTGTGANAATITLEGDAGSLEGSARWGEGLFFFADVAIESVDGDITLHGEGYGRDTGGGYGVSLGPGGGISSSGTGDFAANITIVGKSYSGNTTGGAGIRNSSTGTSDGTVIPGMPITSVDGDIILRGEADGAAPLESTSTAIANGVFLTSGLVATSGLGAISISGTGPVGSVGENGYDNFGGSGVYLAGQDTTVSAGIGGILIEGFMPMRDGRKFGGKGVEIVGGTQVLANHGGSIRLFGEGDNAPDVLITGIVRTVGGGQIEATVNSFSVSAIAVVDAGSGRVLISPRTAGLSINLGGADSATALGLSDAKLDRITAHLLQIGDPTAGDIRLAGPITQTGSGYERFKLVTGGSVITATDVNEIGITVDHFSVQAGGNIGTSQAGLIQTSVGFLTVDAFGEVHLQNTGSLTIGNLAAQKHAIGVLGAVTIDSTAVLDVARLNFAATSFSSGPISPVRITNDEADGVAGMFVGLEEGAVIRTVDELAVRITYQGGDGNDIIVFLNQSPMAAGNAVGIHESETTTGNLILNDYDPDGDGLIVVAIQGDATFVGQTITLASGAQLLVNADGSFTFDPAGAYSYLKIGETAAETFNYTVSDGFGGMAVATVEVVIHGATNVIVGDVNPATTDVANAQSESEIGIGANGHVVVAWTHTTDSGDTDVRFRRYTPSGAAIDDFDRVVYRQASGDEDSPCVVVAADGSFFIGYRVIDEEGNSSVFVDRYNIAGLLAYSTQLFDARSNHQSNLDIATNGNIIAAWQEQRNGNDDVIVQVFNVQGDALLGPIALADEASGSAETNPAVAVDRAGNFVVAYSTASGVAVQRFSASGAPLGTRLLLSPPALPPGDLLGAPQLDRAADGSFVVAYAVTPASGSPYGYWHLLNADGSLRAQGATSPGTVIGSVSMDAIGDFVVGVSRTTLGGDVQAEAIFFNSAGQRGEIAVINQDPSGTQSTPRVALSRDTLAASYLNSSGVGDVEFSLIRQRRSQFGVARPNAGSGLTFFLDSNGDGVFNSGDAVFNFGLAGDIVVVGDWNGDGIDDFGVARSNGTGGLRFYLDSNGNRGFDSSDRVFDFGLVGDIIVVGDWNGDGIADLGVGRRNASGGLVFSLDGNGSWGFDNSDAVFNFGLAGDTIVVGDWNGDGIDDLGVARRNASGGLVFSLDSNGSWSFDGADAVFNFGLERDRVIVGDWNGDGADGLGVVRPNGTGGQTIYRDVNENFGFDLTDSLFASNFGLADDLLLAGSWR